MKKPSSLALASGFLAAVYLLVLLAGFFAPYSFETQERYHPFSPPTKIHFVDAGGKFHWWPFVYAGTSREDAPTEYEEDRSTRYPIRLFVHGDRYTLLGLFDSRLHLFGVDEHTRLYLFGSDGFGRDQFSRLLYGGRVSLFAGLLAAIFAVAIGLVLGGIAGFYGKVLDEGIMRLAELFIVVPWFYFLIAVRAFLPLQMDPALAFFLVAGVIGVVGWARPARLVRGVVLSAKERNFVLAARGFGASGFYIWRRHILPSTAGVALTQLALLIPQFILAEVILSFLGLGIGEPVPSWGNMLAAAQQYHILVSYWWMLLPSMAPIPVFIAYHVIVDNLHTRLQLAT